MGVVGKLSQDLIYICAQSARELATVEGNILSSAREKEIRTMYVTSCKPKEGKTISAISMAYTLSNKINFKVLLVEGNLYFPKISESFNVNNSYCFSDLIASDMDLNDVLVKTEHDNLYLMTHGSQNVHTLDVVKLNTFFCNKFNAIKQKFNYVIFDGCSVFGFSDVPIIARHFDGLLFVVECEKTKWEMFQQAKEKVEMAGGHILGAVMNKRKYYIPKMLYGKI
ncbi:MAG: CpsD/CapB family tyrosine-protein kinase [Patescibacteria group bacterium]